MCNSSKLRSLTIQRYSRTLVMHLAVGSTRAGMLTTEKHCGALNSPISDLQLKKQLERGADSSLTCSGSTKETCSLNICWKVLLSYPL